MSEVKDVRAALEKLRSEPSVGGDSTAGSIVEAIVSEGLAACDELENAPDQPLIFTSAIAKVELVASILRKVGLL